MTEAAIISGSLVDVRNVGTHKSVKLTIHVPEEYATRVVAAFGWPTGVNPVSVAIARMESQRVAAAPVEEAAPQPVSRSSAGADGERRRFDSLPYAQQAALRCNDPIYHAFLREMCAREAANAPFSRTPEAAAVTVRQICEVESRGDIRPDTDAEKKWLELERWFAAWLTKERAIG